MMDLVPITALVSPAVAAWIAEASDDAWQRMAESDGVTPQGQLELDELERLMLTVNGWSRVDYIAGSLISISYEQQTGLDAWPDA